MASSPQVLAKDGECGRRTRPQVDDVLIVCHGGAGGVRGDEGRDYTGWLLREEAQPPVRKGPGTAVPACAAAHDTIDSSPGRDFQVPAFFLPTRRAGVRFRLASVHAHGFSGSVVRRCTPPPFPLAGRATRTILMLALTTHHECLRRQAAATERRADAHVGLHCRSCPIDNSTRSRLNLSVCNFRFRRHEKPAAPDVATGADRLR